MRSGQPSRPRRRTAAQTTYPGGKLRFANFDHLDALLHE